MPSKLTISLCVTAVLLPASLVLLWPLIPAKGTIASMSHRGSVYPDSLVAFEKVVGGPELVGHPRISNVQITKLYSEEVLAGVLVCDVFRSSLVYHRAIGSGKWSDEVLLADVAAPAHASVVDMDGDSDLDIVLSVLGNIEPDDGLIGRVILLTQENGHWTPSIILDDVRRVADAQPGDFDADGDLDLAVAVFGYNRGQVLWLENKANGQFQEHELLSGPGVIHVPIVDLDGDGDLDIAAPVTQDEEEIWGFENVGGGQFRRHKLWYSNNFDLGSAGLISADLDGDGDADLLLPAGDNLEDFDPFPQPYHGCYMFENLGDWNFREKRISDLGGTYAAACGDIDGDGDPDVALVSMANVWDEPERASLVWLENDGKAVFKSWQIASSPTHLITVALGDVNGDSRNDIVAGGLHIRGPYNRLGRVTAWLNKGMKP